MKLNDLIGLLFDLIHDDNEVSAFYILEYAETVLKRRKRNEKVQLITNSIGAVLQKVFDIECTVYGGIDTERLYSYRRIDKYFEKAADDADSTVKERVLDIISSAKCEYEKASDYIWNYCGEININTFADDMYKWYIKVPDEARHPFA